MLHSFARYADGSGHCGPLTTELALRWARLPEQAARVYQARRLEVVRTLAQYLAPREPGTEVPPRGLLGPAHARRPAFIYTEADIAALIDAARALGPTGSLRPRTFAALIGLLACTGLRIGEALVLQASDADLDAGVLTVRHTKFHKSRLVPLHASAVGSLRDYATARGRRHPGLTNTAFFVSDAGRPLPYGTVRHTFHRLLRQAMPGVCSARTGPAAAVRPAAHLRLSSSPGLVSRRDGFRSSHRPTLDLPGPRQGHRHLLVSGRHPGAVGAGGATVRAVCSPLNGRRCLMTPPLDILVQDFFCRRLIEQQGASRRTIEAYRDAFRLLLAYLPVRLKKPVPSLELSDFDAPVILAFLDHLETERQQWAAHSQRPPGGRALLRAIRGIARPDRLAAGPTGAGHPVQALYQAVARLPDP